MRARLQVLDKIAKECTKQGVLWRLSGGLPSWNWVAVIAGYTQERQIDSGKVCVHTHLVSREERCVLRVYGREGTAVIADPYCARHKSHAGCS